MIDEENIFKFLKLSGVPPEKARQRAIWLVDDLQWIDLKTFEIFAEHSGVEDPFSGASIPLVEYVFGKTPFSVDNASHSSDKRSTSIGGSLLNRGNLRHLSIVSEIGRRMLPDIWGIEDDLRQYLRRPDKHLDTLNEVWWLGRFGSAVDVKPRHKMHTGPEDIDWRFRLEGTDIWVNLEAKNRPSDASRHSHGIHIGPSRWLKDTADKFIPGSSNEINIVGLTLFGQIDRSVQQSVAEWLSRQPAVDGVLIWSHEGRNKSIFDMQLKSPNARLLKMGFVSEPTEERELIVRHEVVLDRKYWSEEMLKSLPQDL